MEFDNSSTFRGQMNKPFITAIAFFFLTISIACASKTDSAGTPIKTVTLGNLTATLASDTGQLKNGEQEVVLSFTDAAGKPVDVGAVSLNFHMPAMGSMAAMNEAVTFTTTNTPGSYRGKVKISMAGEWQCQLAYEGPAGSAKTTFSVTAH